ncbi:hypothetical protein RS82_01255 [Microbacterium trichothecenolyticum]|uniref:Uncharacterized protein n=1 Tax=Microbacterium trichothecenolyticum TaxID=69370 RepID=A0A0M2HBK6_MICTR|nr:hypothetical protein RS82_01255 [Microbacterium trichothecenolyticum]
MVVEVGVERGPELVGGQGQRIQSEAGAAEPQGGDRRYGQPHAHRVEVLRTAAQHVIHRAVGRQEAVVVEHHDPVDEAYGGVEVVLDEEDRPVAGCDEFGEGGVHLFDPGGVEIRGRLVEHEERRPHREGARDREPLASAARQAVGVVASAFPQADPAEGLLGAGEHHCHRHPEILRPERHLVEERAGDELRVRVLEHHADAGAELGDGRRLGVESLDLDRSGDGRRHGLRQQPIESEGQRRLARPARAEQQHHFSGGDIERDGCRRRRGLAVMGDAELAHPQQRHGSRHGHPIVEGNLAFPNLPGARMAAKRRAE